MERQIDEKIVKKQNEIAASSFRSGKLRRNLKIYVSNTFSEGENGPGVSNISSLAGSSEDIHQLASINASGACWILRIEGKIDLSGLSAPSSSSSAAGASSKGRSSTPLSSSSSSVGAMKKFSQYLKCLLVEFDTGEVVEWNRMASSAINCDGFEIRRPLVEGGGGENYSNTTVLPTCKIHLQFDFCPERFRVAPALASLLNLQLATRPAIVVALWQYIKLHKLQESDEKKIINNDSALQALFKVPRMSFSEIPMLVEPYLLPPEPVTISYALRGNELNVLEQVFELEVDIDDPKMIGAGKSFLPANFSRDLNFYEGRIRELVEALHSSQMNRSILASFGADPISTAQKLLKSATRDYETIVGDVPVTLDELTSASFYDSESVVEAVNDFLALNPRFLQY